MSKFVVRNVNTGIKFDLVAGNGEAIGTSEVYSGMAACEKGIESVRHNAPIAHMEDQTMEGFEEKAHPKFEIYNDHAGHPRFRLKARNGQEILASQAYKSKEACEKGIHSVVHNAPTAEVVHKQD